MCNVACGQIIFAGGNNIVSYMVSLNMGYMVVCENLRCAYGGRVPNKITSAR